MVREDADAPPDAISFFLEFCEESVYVRELDLFAKS
jgi:hypothetical protein